MRWKIIQQKQKVIQTDQQKGSVAKQELDSANQQKPLIMTQLEKSQKALSGAQNALSLIGSAQQETQRKQQHCPEAQQKGNRCGTQTFESCKCFPKRKQERTFPR